jgi:hydroxyethylthiazole kinase-like uncharacterized protein yjeF
MMTMRVLSAAEMKACDVITTERFGISSIDLMRTAARAVVGFVQAECPDAHRFTVLCGRGNNGGDGMMAARLLATAGLDVTTLLLGASEGLTGDAATAWGELTASAAAGAARVVAIESELAAHHDALNTDLLLDAVVGTGFKPPLRGMALAALEWVKSCAAPVLSVDLPSGWSADTTGATSDEPVFRSDAVVTFTAPKNAHVFSQLTRRWDQPVVVAPIGSPEQAIVSAARLTWAGAAMELIRAPREADSNKGKFGHVLVVGGSAGKSGAPSMTALAAMRSGAGLVTAAVPGPVQGLVALVAPELMTWGLQAGTDGGISADALNPEKLAALLKGITVLAIGPGLGQSDATAEFVTGLLAATKIPVVIDADALNILAARPELLAGVGERRMVVMTPHPGEMARLAGIKTAEIQADRLEVARSFATKHSVTLVLKGARTLIAHPDGRVAVNTTGNPGMAKGGSGDQLTGFIAGLLAQHAPKSADRGDAERAVEAAVYLHGLAADMAVRAGDEHTLLASDSLRQLSRAFRFDSRGRNGYVWLQGLPAASTPDVSSI